MNNSNAMERLYNGLIKENPTFVLMLGMCPGLPSEPSRMPLCPPSWPHSDLGGNHIGNERFGHGADYYGGTGIEQYDDFHAAEYYSG